MSTAPLPPDYGPFLQRIAAGVMASPPAVPDSPFAGAPAPVLQAAREALAAATGDLLALSHDVHAHPELGFAEHHAAAAVADLLRTHGHEVTVGGWGLSTAVHARAGQDRPRVAFLAEYDALPGIGHACGHNVICATSVGGFLAAAAVVDQVGGSVELIGTPAEEGGGGKEIIARAGGLDEVDAALMLHPFSADIVDHPFIGVRTVEVVFSGTTAHASAMPFMGRNALDAAVQAYTGMAQLRQHMLPSDRVHGIFTDGGQKPNIVPERAAVLFFIRSAEPDTLQALCDRATAIFEGAAMQAGVGVDIRWEAEAPVYLPTRLNAALGGRYARHAADRGRAVLPRGVLPEAMTGSTDLGNVSVRVPAIHPMLGIAPFGTSLHTPDFTGHAVSDAADEGVVDGSLALALTALDFLADPQLQQAVAGEFAAQGGALAVEELYP